MCTTSICYTDFCNLLHTPGIDQQMFAQMQHTTCSSLIHPGTLHWCNRTRANEHMWGNPGVGMGEGAGTCNTGIPDPCAGSWPVRKNINCLSIVSALMCRSVAHAIASWCTCLWAMPYLKPGQQCRVPVQHLQQYDECCPGKQPGSCQQHDHPTQSSQQQL